MEKEKKQIFDKRKEIKEESNTTVLSAGRGNIQALQIQIGSPL